MNNSGNSLNTLIPTLEKTFAKQADAVVDIDKQIAELTERRKQLLGSNVLLQNRIQQIKNTPGFQEAVGRAMTSKKADK
jgi:hypothetical protein